MAHNRFSLFRFRSPLLTESRLFSLPVGTEMFHFPTFPLSALYIQTEIMGLDSHWVPPFGNPRIKALLAAPRGFSQPHTTFFGFWCLGIRHLHLIIFLLKDARVHCVVLKIRAVLTTPAELSPSCEVDTVDCYEFQRVRTLRTQQCAANNFLEDVFHSSKPKLTSCTNDFYRLFTKNQCST